MSQDASKDNLDGSLFNLRSTRNSFIGLRTHFTVPTIGLYGAKQSLSRPRVILRLAKKYNLFMNYFKGSGLRRHRIKNTSSDFKHTQRRCLVQTEALFA